MMQKYLQQYKAKVIDNDDPKGLNRVQINVKGLFDGVHKDYLPWAKWKSPFPVKAGFGCYIKPPKDSYVWVVFAEGDVNDPYYFGGVYDSKDDAPDSVIDKRYIIFESPDRHICIAFNDNTNKLEIKCGDINTDLETIVTSFLNHSHFYMPSTMPAAVMVTTSAPDKTAAVPPVPPPGLPYTSADFNTGTL